MASSLAQQLAQSASLNSSLLVDRSRRKPTPSYLFTAREADQHDLNSIHALAFNAFFRLKSVEPALSVYEDALFSDAAKATDRTLQNADANEKLDNSLNSFLPLLGPFLLENPTGKVIEWLVRRFRIHEFNVDAVLALFLPYQESPHFTKMLSILHISEQSRFAGLLAHKSTSAPLTHNALVSLMLKPNNEDLSRFAGSLLLAAIKAESGAAVHRALIAFHTGVLLDFVRSNAQRRKGALDEGTLAWVLPAALEPLEICSSLEVESSREGLITEVILSSYLLLSALSHTCPLTSKALSSMLKSVVSCSARVSTKQLVRTLASLCVPQEPSVVSPLPKSVVKALMRQPQLEEELKEALKYAGTEKFVAPFVQGLLAKLDDECAFSTITSLVTYQKLPRAIVRDLANSLIALALGSDDSDAGAFSRGRSILVHIQQRHPAVLQESFEIALNGAGDKREVLEQLLISLSVNMPGVAIATPSNSETDMVVASTSADSTLRTIAVQKLHEQLGEGTVPATDMISVRSALLARVHDTHVSVLDALYSKPDTLLPLILSDASGYIQMLSDTLHSPTSSPARNIIRSHLRFVSAHLYPRLAAHDNATELTTAAFQSIFFPYLLFSKSRQKTTAIVWDLIKESGGRKASLAQYDLLRGCVDIVDRDNDNDSAESLAKLNVALAFKIAENVISSGSVASHLEFILRKLQDSNAYSKALAYLVSRALLGQLSGEQQVDVAHDVLVAMDLESLNGMDDVASDAAGVQASLDEASLQLAVYQKPSKRSTISKLQLSILALLSSVSRPTGALDWIEASGNGVSSARYIGLMRKFYMLVNSSNAIPALSMHLTQAQFICLGEDALKFLAGVWLQPTTSPTFHPAQYTALRHAAAFMEAHYSSQRFIDFQTILPAVLVAVHSPDQRLREAALECVGALVRLSQAKKPLAVYAFDAVYGSSSGDLQYLDWSDLSRYINALNSVKDHLTNDASYLRVFHQQHLLTIKTDSKKEASYKSRIICFLLSHVISCTLLSAKTALLHSMEEVSNSAKLKMLLPVAERLASTTSTSGESDEDFVGLVLACFDQTAAVALNDRAGPSWDVYLKVLRQYFSASASTVPRTVLARNLERGLFAKLHLERKVEVCKVLLEQSQEHADVSGECRVLLGGLVSEVDVIVDLLAALQPTVADAAQRASKRAKLDSSGGDTYALLSLLGEVLGAKPLPGSLDLVSSLLETLNKVVHDTSSSAADKAYTEQLLMSALENVASNVSGAVPAANIRLDVLVELIRVSENPQTFNQALLLMATLTRLAPDAVVHNVMPVFTFMGSNVFHRDDSYSFRVVEKTIDAIVPVMVSNLKKSHTDKFQMQLASRSFLRIFTDAANHIPRHRRTAFFGHLVDMLNPSDLLAPLCLLLVDKASNKIVRQVPADSSNTLSLPLATLHRYSAELQIAAIVEMLQEAQRLLNVELKLSSSTPTFLEASHDDERNAHSSAPKRQAHAIIIFVTHALQQLAQQSRKSPPSKETSSALLAALLDIAVSKKSKLAEASLSYISKAADEAVRDALAIMSAADFVNGVLTVVDIGEASIMDGALNILGEQLSNVTEKVRQDLKPSILKIIDAVKKLIPTADASSSLPAAFHSLSSIALTVTSGEEHALTSTVPLIISSIRQQRAPAVALETLLILTNKLGPRTIPFFKDIVKECVAILASGNLSASAQAIQVLQALLSSIPNFWSSAEIVQVLNLYLECSVSASSSVTGQVWTFVKTLSKKVPSKVLVPTLCEYWSTLASSENIVLAKHVGYFSVLKRTLHTADRSVVSEHLRSLFKIFMDAFGLCLDATYKAEVQTGIIATFLELVVKINEAIFRPLFRKLFDWAFTSDADAGRKVVFCDVYAALLDYFKNLMTPYMSFLLQPFAELLTRFIKFIDNEDLWLALVRTLTKSFAYDEAAFWRDDRLRQLTAPLIAQVPVCTHLDAPDARNALSECLVALAEAVTDDMLLKSINLDVLMHTRAEEARVRLYALTCSEALWRAHGAKLMGFAGESATFVAECAEDDNDSVVREAHRLKNAIESVAGRIDV